MKSKMKEDPITGPISVTMNFFMKRPKSVSRDYPTVTPDIDNCIKYYLDCGNKVLWEDDKNIVKIVATQQYDENPRTEIKVEGL